MCKLERVNCLPELHNLQICLKWRLGHQVHIALDHFLIFDRPFVDFRYLRKTAGFFRERKCGIDHTILIFNHLHCNFWLL